MSSWTQMMMQDSLSSTMLMMLSFHDSILMTMTLVLSIIAYMMIFLMTSNFSNSKLKEAHKVELMWTVTPSIILLLLAMPSLHLLYLTDELHTPSITVKITGHQWYWNYEYSDFPLIKFDSFMLNNNSLNYGQFRLLEVDNRLIIPMQTEVRLLITASDVIHSWTIQPLGVKIDAIPGRLNQSTIIMTRPGVYYGQCSEICGSNHSFMPIALESINMKSFISWTKPL